MSVLIKGGSLPDNCAECPCLRHDSIDGINAYQCNLTLKTYDDNTQEMWTARDEDCPMATLNALKDQIYIVKHNLKSENSDYLTGYICALSAVEGMIAEVEV